MTKPTAAPAREGPGPARDARRVEAAIGRLLQGGTALAALVILAGAALYLARHGAELPDWSSFHGEPDELRSPAGIVRAALSGGGRGLVALGLLLLVATPVARVALAVIAFALLRDRKFVVVSLLVLAGLLASLAGVLPHGGARRLSPPEPPAPTARPAPPR